ncbi:MAG: hypothetical protein J6U65_08650, partial [Bacteroidaceae bacterium]|nr:hypothetical protein [Bacteroidaceae bacterium]
ELHLETPRLRQSCTTLSGSVEQVKQSPTLTSEEEKQTRQEDLCQNVKFAFPPHYYLVISK